MLRVPVYADPVTDAVPSSSYPGERLGLPASGRGSIAKLGRRIAALAIDFACAAMISLAFFSYDGVASTVIFGIVQVLFIPTIGGSPGHRILGMRLVRAGGGWSGLWRPVVRTVLLILVIPAVIWDTDHRGMHDKAAGTVLIRG